MNDIWFGTTTSVSGLSQGIYHATLNENTGQISASKLVAKIQSPGFLANHPNLPIMYAIAQHDGAPSAVAFKKSSNGDLEFLNSQPIGDDGVAHLSTDKTGKILVTAQYTGGSVAVFPLGENGQIGERTQLLKHTGGSRVYQRRQDSPHPHWVGYDTTGSYICVPDLGMDQVVIYEISGQQLKRIGAGICPPGGGPRHMKFHPNGKFAFVLNELSLSVSVFKLDVAPLQMRENQVIQTLPDEIKARETFNSASEIRVHPNGRFIYTANRGHDSITCFEFDETSGKLSLIEIEPVRGSWPRNFNLSPSGRWLVAAGRDSNTAAVFRIEDDGQLTYIRQSSFVPTPICVLFGIGN